MAPDTVESTALRTLTRADTEFVRRYVNRISPKGAQALAKALESNDSLASLGLGFNNVGEGGARALSNALRINRSLASLHIDKANIGQEWVKRLRTYRRDDGSDERVIQSAPLRHGSL